MIIVDGNANRPKPSPRYAQLSATFRAAGANVEDNEFEKIDAILNGEKWNDPKRRNRTKHDSIETNPIEILSAEALRESGYMSQDTDSPDPLIDGYLPRTRQFLMN
jgi:hypothetical protein